LLILNLSDRVVWAKWSAVSNVWKSICSPCQLTGTRKNLLQNALNWAART